MASANVDLVRSIFAAWDRGDFSSAEWADPEIEFVLADGPDPGRWTGVAEMAERFGERMSAWKDVRTAGAKEYRELDSERVLVFYENTGRGTTSGLELAQMRTRAANVFHVRRGRVTRLAIYSDRDRALADLGLGPEADSPHS